MGNWNWFAPKTKERLEGEEWGLPPGEWIEIRTSLNYEEASNVRSAGLLAARRDEFTGDQSIDLNVGAFGIAKLQAWITDWSAVDLQTGERIPFNASAVLELDDATGRLLAETIQRYEDKLEGNELPSPVSATGEIGSGSESES